MTKRPSNTKAKRAAVERLPPIRLACVSCDRDDYDGVWRLPKNWTGIQKWQTLSESMKEIAESDSSRSAFDWHTHMGYCPECQQADS